MNIFLFGNLDDSFFFFEKKFKNYKLYEDEKNCGSRASSKSDNLLPNLVIFFLIIINIYISIFVHCIQSIGVLLVLAVLVDLLYHKL